MFCIQTHGHMLLFICCSSLISLNLIYYTIVSSLSIHLAQSHLSPFISQPHLAQSLISLLSSLAHLSPFISQSHFLISLKQSHFLFSPYFLNNLIFSSLYNLISIFSKIISFSILYIFCKTILLTKLSISILIKLSISICIKLSRIWLLSKKMKGGQGKNECLLKEIVKKAICDYGMIISVIVQHILKIFFDDGLE